MALDRFLSIRSRQWRTGFFKGKNVVVYALLVCILLIILNSSSLVTNGYMTYVNGTEQVVCYAWYSNNYDIFDLLGRVKIRF